MSADDVVQKISFVGIRICKSGSGFQSHPMAVEDFSSETRRPKTTNCVMIRLGHVQLGGRLSMRPAASGYEPLYTAMLLSPTIAPVNILRTMSHFKGIAS